MTRFRRRRKSSGGGSRNGMNLTQVGLLSTIMGGILMIVCVLAFNIVIGQIDTSYTAAATYTEQVGVAEFIGMAPMLVWIILASLGLGALGLGGYSQWKAAATGDTVQMIWVAIGAALSVIVTFIVWGIIQPQIHTAWTTANATTNIAHFSGVLDMIGIWGMVVFATMLLSSLAGIGSLGYRGYKYIRG